MKKGLDIQHLDINYEIAFYSRLQELGINQIYEPGSETGAHNTKFLELMSATRKALKKEVKMRKIDNKFDLEKVVSDPDNFTVGAARDNWFSTEVDLVWREYKRNYLVEIMESEDDIPNKKEAISRFSWIKSLSLGLAKLSIYGVVTGAAVAAGTYFTYKYFIKPDIRNEIQDSIPYIPTIDEMKTEFLRELNNHQNGLTQDDINRICDTVEERYPFFKNMKKQGEKNKE